MADFLSLLFLLPLLPVHAVPQAPPGITISNGEVEPIGTVTACSTITTTIGTLVNVIPVPCASSGAALPSIFTEVVDVGGTTASLVVGPTDIEFVSESWLQPTATPSSSGASPSLGSSSASGSSSGSITSVSASGSASASGPISGSGSVTGSISMTDISLSSGSASITRSGSASGSGVSDSASVSGSISASDSGSPSGTAPNTGSGLASSSGVPGSASVTNSGPFSRSVSTTSSGSSSRSAPSGNASSDNLSGSSSGSASVIGSASASGSGVSASSSVTGLGSISGSSVPTTPSATGSGVSVSGSQSATDSVSGTATSGSSPAPIVPSSTVGGSVSVSDCILRPSVSSGALSSSGSSSIFSSSISESINYCPVSSPASSSSFAASASGSILSSLGSSSVSQTASPASTTSGLPSSTPASITATSSGTSNTALFVPVTSPATTIAAVGVLASSSAKAVQTSVAIIIPLIQSYIKDPSCPSCPTEAINALKGVLPTIEELSDEIGPGPSSQNCDASINLLQDIFNAVKCTAQNVEKAIRLIEGGENKIDDLTSTVTSLTDLQKPLDNDSKDDDNSSKGQSSQDSQSETSTSQTSSSQSSSSSASSSVSSSVSSSAFSSSSSSASSGSCLLPPEITLPPDSLTGIAQPDQPTSVVVTGLPSVDGSSGASGLGSSSATSSTSASPSSSSSLPSITGPTSTAGSSTALSSAPAPSTAASSTPASSTSSTSITPAPAKSTIAPNFCMTDGAPWYSPKSWCDCGPSSTYPLRSASGASAGDCSYTTLPDSTIQPVSTSAAPTNIPGQGGLPGCNYVLYPNGQGCPYANYCNCGGTYVGLLTTTISGTSTMNCDYTLQPTANSCPPPTTTPATSTPPPPATSTAAPPPPKANVAVIGYREDTCGDLYAGCNSDGRVYDITPGQVVPVCRTAKTAATWDYTEDVQNETKDYNIQTPTFTSHDTYKNCQYKGTADIVGSFNCDGFPTPVQCITPAIQATSCSSSHSLDQDDFIPIFYCEWYSPPSSRKRSQDHMNRFRHVEW